jgi:hypothetical protein
MKNKKIIISIVGIIILIVIGVNISYADFLTDIGVNNQIKENESCFFEVNKTEISQGETLEMTINLSQIEYSQFEFTLNSNIELADNIYTNDEENIKLSEENNAVEINIVKENLNLDKIVLYYQIPENLQVGSKIQLNANITEIATNTNNVEGNIENNDEIQKEENSKNNDELQEENNDINNEENVVDAESISKQIEITIVEKSSNSDEPQKDIDTSSKKEEQDQQNNKENQFSMQDLNSSNQTISGVSNSMQNMSSNGENQSISSQSETAVYNGSSNNYLSSLEIEGIDLTSEFTKEKQTYFATVEDTETITVNAIAEDSESKVVVTGADLKDGENKILISVTAENGNVRYYRIYVTKK